MPIFQESIYNKFVYFVFNIDFSNETINPYFNTSKYIRYMNKFYDDFIDYNPNDFFSFLKKKKLKKNINSDIDKIVNFEKRYLYFMKIPQCTNRPFIKYNKTFLTNGNFDYSKFNKVINNYNMFKSQIINELELTGKLSKKL